MSSYRSAILYQYMSITELFNADVQFCAVSYVEHFAVVIASGTGCSY